MLPEFLTEKRYKTFMRAICNSQPTLSVVFENIHDRHNVSAIYRSCEAVGVRDVNFMYYIEKFPKIGKKSSSSAFKWIEHNKFESVKDCYSHLKNNGFKIYASILDPEACSLYDLDLTEKCAIVLGNEHRGISDEAGNLADKKFYIPMRGMIQSLNVSVAGAVSLYEAQRQRMQKGMYDVPQYSDEEIEAKIKEWANK